MNKRLWVSLALGMAVLALSCGAGFAMPSLGGPTGIVSVPNALVAPVGELQLALGYQKVTESVAVPSGSATEVLAQNALRQWAGRKLAAAQAMYESETSADFHVWSLQALSGVADGAELWAQYGRASGDFFDHLWGVGGKFQLLREPKDQAYLAVFASYQSVNAKGLEMYDGGEEDLTGHVTKLGLVATKDLTPTGVGGASGMSGKLYGSAGLVYMKTGGDFSSENQTKPFLGLEYATTDGTTVGAEYRWKDSDLDAKAVWSLVLKHNFPKGWAAEIGTTNADPIGFGTDDQNIFVRVGYTFAVGKY